MKLKTGEVTKHMEFKTGLPRECPPIHAKSVNIHPVYRFTTTNVPSESDFLNHVEKKNPYPPQKKCEAMALSFFTTREAADELQRSIKRFKKMSISEGRINQSAGVCTINKKQHLNLWLFKDVTAHKMVNIFNGKESGNDAK